MTMDDFIFLSSFYYKMPARLQRHMDCIWGDLMDVGNQINSFNFENWFQHRYSNSLQKILQNFVSVLKDGKNLTKKSENAYTINPQQILEVIKNNHGITDLDIEEVVFEGYHEGVAGPGVFLFSFPKEKREKKDRIEKKIKKIHKENKKDTFDFDSFWLSYPRKRGKGKAKESFTAIFKSELATTRLPSPLTLLDEILLAINNQLTEKKLAAQWDCFTAEWPHPATWLNQHRWTDEVQLNMEYWENECKRNHKHNEYLRIRDRNLTQGIADDDNESF